MKNLQTKLATVRAQIEKLVDERGELEDAPIPRSEAEDLIAAVVAAPFSGTIINTEFNPRADFDPAPTGLINGTFDSHELLQTLERPSVLRAIFPEALKAYLIEIYDRALGDTAPGLPMAERRARLAEITTEIFALEVTEEGIIEELEASGADVQRRADADPVAQLGLEVA